MQVDQGLRYARHRFDGLLRRVAGHVGWQREQRDDEQNRKAATLQVLTLLHKGEQEHTKADSHADRREVIEQKVKMNELRGRQHDRGPADRRRHSPRRRTRSIGPMR